jgi:hypothetical protein
MGGDLISVAKILSGAQTGADRAALDFAIARGIPHGGWAPSGRAAEDGPIPDQYDLRESPSADPIERTEWNVRDADATLIVSMGPLTGGSLDTLRMAERHRKPALHVDRTRMGAVEAARAVRDWLAEVRPVVLNIAGPRASTTPGIGAVVLDLLSRVFDASG